VATPSNPAIARVAVNQEARTIAVTALAPGVTALTITDGRGVTASVPLTFAYAAGRIVPAATLRITGDPASPAFIASEALAFVRAITEARPGAQVVLTPEAVSVVRPLPQDDDTEVEVPVLIQGEGMLPVQGTTRVHVENIAVPAIRPDQLMVSDFPEELRSDGILFSADVRSDRPSRFLYFHDDPPGAPLRRLVLRLHNLSPLPTTVQYIAGKGGPDVYGMEAGHRATETFLAHLVQNEGRLIEIPGNATISVSEDDLLPGTTACGLLQLRVLDPGVVHLTLIARSAGDASDARADGALLLLRGIHRHARGIYPVPEFHYATQWSVDEPYLVLPVGQIPLPNELRGHALAGDYGVLESFVIDVTNPTAAPQQIALYENPRGGSATGTYIIDGVLVQSHQVPAFSRYQLRQYVVPAHGFVRITIVTMPEAGSSYPLDIIVAPDDGSVPPGAPGSPIY